MDEWRALSHPKAARVNGDDWGRAFSRVARDWAAPPARANGPLIRGGSCLGGGRKPDVVALFSFRYDAHLVADLVENISPFVDGWIAYDDRGGQALFTDETDRRRVLVQAAHEVGARWVLAVDPDERFERALADRIGDMTASMAPISWSFRFRELYEPDRYRVDGLWGAKTQQRLFPLRGDLMLSNRALHAPWCGFPTVDSGLNLYHLKMIAPHRRQGRRALYNHLDPQRVFQAIGYDYLADDAGATLETIALGREYAPAHHDDGGLWMPSVRQA